jgi:hypothetical protein
MLGALNPLPMRLGGGPTEVSRAYKTIRDAVGEGGSAPNDRGLDGLWRRSRARGLAAATSANRRALLNSWPHLATDLLPYYERVLGLVPDVGASDAVRRATVVAAWTAQLSATIPALAEQLAALDARFTILSLQPTQGRHTQAGRTLGPLVSSEPTWGSTPAASNYPNDATAFVLQLRFTVGYATALSSVDSALLEQALDILRRRLPSWVSWEVTTSTGFETGVSPLGLTGLSDG